MALPFAVPLLAGIGTVISSAFVGLVTWLTAVSSRKIAIGAALAAFMVAGWVVIQAAFIAAFTALAWAMPSEMVVPLKFVSYLLPSNTAICVQTVILAKVAAWLWDAKREWAKATAIS